METMSLGTLIISIATLALTFFILYVTGQRNKIREKVIELVEKAEDKFGGGTGNIKYHYVVTEINKYIPPKLKPFITDYLIDQFIKDSVYALKDKVDDDKLNNSYPK